MGCWGITAFESDAGLDSVGYIRRNLPQDGRLELGEIIEALKRDQVRLPDMQDTESHSSPMALAEIIIKMLDRDFKDLDYEDEQPADDKKFADITSFSASKESLRWLREYLSATLQNAIESAEERMDYNGWFEEKNWIGWQEHMKKLISRVDGLLDIPEDNIELLNLQSNPEPGCGGFDLKM